MSNLTLRRVSSLTREQVQHCDFSFKTNIQVAKPYSQLELDQPIATAPLPELTKDFGFDAEDASGADGLQKVIVVLEGDNKVWAYAIATKGWNNMVHLEYIALDRTVRGHGNAILLLEAVADWTKEVGLIAIRAECQSNNVAACRLYKKAGFVFGGYDEYLYKAIPETRAETAIFMYKFLNKTE